MRVKHAVTATWWSIAVLGFGVLAPFTVNAFFANPLTDDYCYSAVARDLGFMEAQRYWYTQWTGRYLTTALLSVNPLVFEMVVGYKMIPVLILLLLIGCIYRVLDGVMGEQATPSIMLVGSVMTLLVWLDQIPDLRSGIYWMAGSITYQFGAALVLLFASLLLKIYGAGATRQALRTEKFLAFCCALLIPGANEVVLAMLVMFVSVVLLNNFCRQRRIDVFLLLLLAVACLGAFVSVMAPGNVVRLSGIAIHRDLSTALWQTIVGASKTLLLWSGSPSVMLSGAFVAWLIVNNRDLAGSLQRFSPGASLGGGIACLLAGFFPTYWSLGTYPAGRVLNMIYLLFLVGLLFNVAVMAARWQILLARLAASRWREPLATVFIVYLLVFSWLGPSNFMQVSRDILSGASYHYDKESRQRQDLLWSFSESAGVVPPLTVLPQSLAFPDLNCIRSGWISQCYARYYHKDSVILDACR